MRHVELSNEFDEREAIYSEEPRKSTIRPASFFSKNDYTIKLRCVNLPCWPSGNLLLWKDFGELELTSWGYILDCKNESDHVGQTGDVCL